MTRGAADMEGRIVSTEEAAIALGFVDVAAMDWFYAAKESNHVIETLLSEIANLRSRVTKLEARLADTGTERVGVNQ